MYVCNTYKTRAADKLGFANDVVGYELHWTNNVNNIYFTT